MELKPDDLPEIARRLIKRARAGNTRALKLLWERLDGRVPQKVEMEAPYRGLTLEEARALPFEQQVALLNRLGSRALIEGRSEAAGYARHISEEEEEQ